MKQYLSIAAFALVSFLFLVSPLQGQETGAEASGEDIAPEGDEIEILETAESQIEEAPEAPEFDPSAIDLPDGIALEDLPNDTGNTLALIWDAESYDAAAHFVIFSRWHTDTEEREVVLELEGTRKGLLEDSPQYFRKLSSFFVFAEEVKGREWYSIMSDDSDEPFRPGQEVTVQLGVIAPALEEEYQTAKDTFAEARKLEAELENARYRLELENRRKKRAELLDKYADAVDEKLAAIAELGITVEDAEADWNDVKGRIHLFSGTYRATTATAAYNPAKTNNLVFAIIFGVVVMWFIARARKDPTLFIRRITGLEAVDEAIGRATEMGKPILFLTGLTTLADLATLAAINILGEVAKKAAEYECDIIVPCRDPVVMAVNQEIVKEAYTKAGRPDIYNEDSVFFLTEDQFSYAASVAGIMLRDKPAANFFMGYYYAESLLLAETGSMTGAIQVAGTDALAQLPFFITACDYTLIGEELYAASAYLSREPLLLGSLKGQDIGKLFLMAVMFFGTLLATIGTYIAADGFDFIHQIFKAL